MERWRNRLGSRAVRCALWVGLCFGLTSAAYLAWLYRLVELSDGTAADWLSMVAGYLLQAAGMGLAAWKLRGEAAAERSAGLFAPAALAFAAATVPAMLSSSLPVSVASGLAMNLICGVVAGLYLFAVARGVPPFRRSLVFGGGYALATVAVGLLALPRGGGRLLGGAALALTALAVYITPRLHPFEPLEDAPAQGDVPALPRRTLALACATIALISLVKNLGFSFPSADIAAGLVPELSRIPYAAGLLIAGIVNDRDRKHGVACAVAALAIPFVMLGLTGEAVPSAVCWGLDYLFFGFFSVFRAVLFLDLAARTRRWELAPLGLLTGRLGDAAGTAIGLMLAGRRLPLIVATAALFVPAVLLCFRLYQRLYEPEAAQRRSEQEVFEAFCLRNDLSAREREVLRMVIANHSNGEIAEALFISESTVKYHVRNMLQKTGCKNRSELQKKYTVALYPRLSDAPRLTLPARPEGVEP